MEVQEIFGNIPTLETERLILRKLTIEDAKDIFSYASNDEVTKYVTWPSHKTIEDTMVFLNFAFDRYEKKDVAPWGIELKETGKIIGTIDFITWNTTHQKAEIGYVLSQDYWGKGIMTEAARKLVEFGFEKMDLVRIEARCMVENIGSARVMEKAGMSYEGTLRKAMFIKGAHRDLKVYAIIKE